MDEWFLVWCCQQSVRDEFWPSLREIDRATSIQKEKKAKIWACDWIAKKPPFSRIIRFESKNIRVDAFVTASISANGLFSKHYSSTYPSFGNGFLGEQRINLFIIIELWSRTDSCLGRRFDFAVGDIVDSTYLTSRFLETDGTRQEWKPTHTSGQGRWKGVIRNFLFLWGTRKNWMRFAVVMIVLCETHSIGKFGISSNLIEVWSADVVFELSLLDKTNWTRAYENMVSCWIQSGFSCEKEAWDR